MAYTFYNTYKVNAKNVLGGTLDKYWFGIDVYTESLGAVSNSTNVKVVAWVKMDAGNVTTSSSTYYFKKDNVTYQRIYIKLGVNDDAGYATPYHANETVFTVYHNQDGTKSITLNFSVETEYEIGANQNLNNGCFKYASITQTIELPRINRISTFSPNDSFVMGKTTSITISRYVSSFTHKLYYHFGNASGLVGENLSTSASWTPSRDLGYQIPNSTSGVGVLTLQTFNGSSLIGEYKLNITLWVSGDMFPSFTLNSSGNDLFGGLFITKHSSINLSIDSSTGSYGSTIKSYSITGEQLSTNSSSGTSGKFLRSGTFTYTATITDSRNRTATRTKSINVYWYEAPKIEWVAVGRANNNKELYDKGNYLFAQLNYLIQNPNGANVNERSYSLEYKETSSASWTTLLSGNLTFYDVSDYECDTQQTFELSKSYDIRFTITDSLESTSITGVLPVASCIMDIEKTGVGIGKYYEKGALDITGDIYIDGKKFYEEGTFNPAFYVSDGCSGIYTRRHGFYQKVGAWCSVTISLVVENFFNGSTPSNQFKITNLPYYNKGGYTAVTIGHQSGLVFTNADSTTRAYIRPNESDVVFVVTRETVGGSYSVTGSNISGSNIDIQVSFTYKVE